MLGQGDKEAVPQRIEGRIVLYEQPTPEGFMFWFGRIEVAATHQEVYQMLDKELYLELEDGRNGIACAVNCQGEEQHVALPNSPPGQLVYLYLFGKSPRLETNLSRDARTKHPWS